MKEHDNHVSPPSEPRSLIVEFSPEDVTRMESMGIVIDDIVATRLLNELCRLRSNISVLTDQASGKVDMTLGDLCQCEVCIRLRWMKAK